MLKASIELKNGRYEVGLLWKNQNVHLPNNRSLAKRRLQQLKKRFDHNPVFAEQQKAVMEDYIAKGYAVKLSEEEASSTKERTRYLPRHGVINPSKPKVRTSMIQLQCMVVLH